MQLFDLMNNLISLNNNLRKKNLEVIRTNIIPMTNGLPNVHGGLIEWIQNSDTINTLLDVVRNRFNVHRDLEKRAEGTGLPISQGSKDVMLSRNLRSSWTGHEGTMDPGDISKSDKRL